MALLRPALLLAVLLTPVFGRRPPDQDPPIKSLRMDPERKRLTWELHGNVSEVTCSINAKAFTKVRNKTYCSFLNLPCQVTNYSIQVTKGQPFSAWILYPEEGGTPRAAAENLTCWVHDTDFLTCSWAVGREAPGDVQYHLYLENPESHRQWPCARYRRDARGTNVQCRFDDFYVFSKTQTRFLVKGTSNSSHVPCLDTMDRLAKLEVLAAPNVTSRWCNHTYSFMQWWVRSHLNNDFKYELQIQKGMNLAYKQETQESFLELRNPGTYTAKVRAMDATFSYQPWGPWSVPQHFVCAGERARLPVWLGALLVALGTLLALGLLLLLCARFSVRQKLFPRIPHMRPPTSDNLQNGSMIAWDPDQDSQEECPVAEVQVLGER
ncbi:interleukin-3 receptor subunit alpha [Hippopotamus amphibius kiboko]|uniref:interleukin-3 receptor subunit alpha n=1 Tax=Hippopotamus amphibius kiboko TaxID=575201 RepID=UPI00259309D1|nr:interleukin-3 receptor subunit alpha [Hippopotamus amphibius kiboko]